MRILDIIQQPLPICRRPFEKLAKTLGCRQESMLAELNNLKKNAFIRRFRARLDYRAMGRAAALAAADVPENKIEPLALVLNQMPGVSHNYLRDHRLNMWFTLQAGSAEEIRRTLKSLQDRFNLEFLDLASVKTFKLDVRFNPAGPEADSLLTQCSQLPAVCTAVAKLCDSEKQILTLLGQDIRFVPEPFDEPAGQLPDTSVGQLLEGIGRLCEKGVIRSIAAAVDHRRLGYRANAMFCLKIDDNSIDFAGHDLARFRIVSHCYQRNTHSQWPYNLYAMLHWACLEDLQNFARKFAGTHKISDFVLLPTVRELKKTPVVFSAGLPGGAAV